MFGIQYDHQKFPKSEVEFSKLFPIPTDCYDYLFQQIWQMVSHVSDAVTINIGSYPEIFIPILSVNNGRFMR